MYLYVLFGIVLIFGGIVNYINCQKDRDEKAWIYDTKWLY